MKEQFVDYYNMSMGYVDKIDAVTSQNTIVRKFSKWTTKLAFQ